MRILINFILAMFSIGVLMAIIGVGAAIYAVYYYGQDLPDYTQLADYKPPVVTRVYAGDGTLIAEYATENRVFVPVEAIPKKVRNAFLAAEDKHFYTHPGVDFFGILRAVLTNIQNLGTDNRKVGASTITQQVAKNFLLSNEVTYERKIKEALLAFRIEQAFSKDQILELYLNEIYLGRGSYGVAAAALNYFNKSLNELSIEECAYLAALPKAPNNYNPVTKYDKALGRRDWVIDRLAEDGYISDEEATEAKSHPLVVHDPEDSRFHYADYFSEEVRREIVDKYGEDALYSGGLLVRTTLDPHLQEIARTALRKGLEAYDRRHGWRGAVAHLDSLTDWPEQLAKIEKPAGTDGWQLAVVLQSGVKTADIGMAGRRSGVITYDHMKWAREWLKGQHVGGAPKQVDSVLKKGDVVLVAPAGDETWGKSKVPVFSLEQVPGIQGAIIALDPHTGRVLAMQGGFSYEQSEFNRVTQALRQPGSAFKPFVYIAALDEGFTPANLILDAPIVKEQGPGLKDWRPTNYSGEFFGPTPLRVGLEKSKNLMTIRLADYIGMKRIAEYAERYGVVDHLQPVLSMSIGAGETTLWRLASAYAVFVNGGKRVIPTIIDRVQDRHGKTVYTHDHRPCEGCGPLIKWSDQAVPQVPDTREQIQDPRTAYQIVDILEGVVQRGTGQRVKSLNRPVAGKTGTTNESRDAWFMGFTPDLVVGVFTGFDDPIPLGKHETGSSVAAPIFKDFMEQALKDSPPVPFRVPEGIRHVRINAETGARAQPGDEKVIWESFIAGTEPTDKIYILDGNGLSLLPTVSGSPEESATVGTGGIY